MGVFREVLNMADYIISLEIAESHSTTAANPELTQQTTDSEIFLQEGSEVDRILDLTVAMMKSQPPEQGCRTIIFLAKKRKSA